VERLDRRNRTGGRLTALSDGTRDQLYLALRIASIERHLDVGEPMPFILDDILVHFDDERAKLALELLGELGERTQVLFFTHHARLRDLAREVLGDALHESLLDSTNEAIPADPATTEPAPRPKKARKKPKPPAKP